MGGTALSVSGARRFVSGPALCGVSVSGPGDPLRPERSLCQGECRAPVLSMSRPRRSLCRGPAFSVSGPRHRRPEQTATESDRSRERRGATQRAAAESNLQFCFPVTISCLSFWIQKPWHEDCMNVDAGDSRCHGRSFSMEKTNG